MAVFQQNLGMTTIQFKQLNALESLNSSFEDSLDILKGIHKGVSDTIPNAIGRQTNMLLAGFVEIFRDSPMTSSLNSINIGVERFEQTVDDATQEMLEQLEENNERQEEESRRRNGESRRFLEIFEDIKGSLKDFATKQWELAADSANEWSKMYNDTIKYIGSDKVESQVFRRDIVNIVDSLNADVSRLGDLGAKIDPQRVMDTMLAISNSSNISDIDTLKAITKPIILAQETTNLNTEELAQVGNRLYNRYNFSSSNIESIVDNIRNMSEGLNVDENKLLTFGDTMATYYGREFGLDADKIEEAMTNAMVGSATLQANNLDSSYFEELSLKAMSDDPTIRNSLYKVLVGEGEAEAFIEQTRSGKGYEAAMTYMESLARYADNPAMLGAGDIGALGTEKDAIAAQQALLALEQGNGTTYEEILEKVKEGNSSSERLEDKFVSIGDQINNNMKGISSYLSTIQEYLGIGMSDITLGVSVLGNVLTVLGGSKAGSTLAAGGKSLLGLLATPGGIAAAAGITALAVTVGSLYDTYKDVNADKLTAAGDLKHGANEDTEFIMSSSIGSDGKVSWSMKGVDTSDFSTEELARFHEDQETKMKEYTDYISSGANLSFGAKFWDAATATTPGGLGYVRNNQLNHASLLEEFQSYMTNDKYREMMNLYTERIDWNSNKQLQGFMDNIDKYLAYYEDGKVAELKKNGTPGNLADIASYDVGTNYVDRDQLAYIHEGEEIVPKKYNPSANMEDLKKLMESQDNSAELESIADVLSDIKDFLSQWKRDNDKKSTIESVKNKVSTVSSLTSYYSNRALLERY